MPMWQNLGGHFYSGRKDKITGEQQNISYIVVQTEILKVMVPK